MTLQVKRGTSAERLGFIPLIGEPFFDTTISGLFIGNGTTSGGILLSGASVRADDNTTIILDNGTTISGVYQGNASFTGSTTGNVTVPSSNTFTLNGQTVSLNSDGALVVNGEVASSGGGYNQLETSLSVQVSSGQVWRFEGVGGGGGGGGGRIGGSSHTFVARVSGADSSHSVKHVTFTGSGTVAVNIGNGGAVGSQTAAGSGVLGGVGGQGFPTIITFNGSNIETVGGGAGGNGGSAGGSSTGSGGFTLSGVQANTAVRPFPNPGTYGSGEVGVGAPGWADFRQIG